MSPAARLHSIGSSVLVLLASTLASAGPPAPTVIGEHLRNVVLETPHPYPAASDSEPELVWSDHYSFPGAAHLVFEFRVFDLAPGDRVEVRDPKRGQVHTYRGKGPRQKGGDFITKMILGSEAFIDLYSRNTSHEHYGYRIERITRGFSESELAQLQAGPEAICGVDDAEDAICYEASFPDVYDRSRAVARTVMDGAVLCTAWLVSCQNHLITANHCTWDDFNFDSQDELDRTEFQFMYQDATCGGNDPGVEYSFMGGTWLENDHDLDYTLIQAPAGEDPASIYGWLALDYRLPGLDEPIYLVGHPNGRPKEIGLYSTEIADQDNPDGFCEVFSTTEPACVGGTAPEIGYFCDSEGAGSGSPVLSRNTDSVVALHHCPNCPNRGVRVQDIWDHNQLGPNPLPSCSFFSDIGSIELDRDRYGCSDSLSIEVIDASILGAGSENVTLWSDTEAAPESLTLIESPVDSGTFVGTLDTTTGTPTSGDGFLSVSDGDTVTARYIDADDGQGGTHLPREAAAQIDCDDPLISNVQAVDVLGTAARIVWDTDEPADSHVFYGTAPPAWSEAGDETRVSAHSVALSGLTECTHYDYEVRSTDEAGNTSTANSGGSYYRFTTGADAVESFGSTDPPLPVIDNTSTYSVIHVSESDPVVDVNVTLNVTHPYDGDVEIYLRGPNGIEIDLSSDNGGTGANYVDTVFDDEAPASIRSATAPFTGAFAPEQPLSTFDGIGAAGDWTLRVFDDETGDLGTLESWTLTLVFPATPCGPHVAYESHVLDLDDCTVGGSGDTDGLWDAGEEIDFSVMLESGGTDSLTGVQATLSALTPGVTVLSGTRPYADLAAGTSGGPVSPFAIHLPDNLTCGDTVDFQLDISATQGEWSVAFGQVVGEVLPSGGTVLDENLDTSGIPPGWAIVDGGETTDTWFTDNAADPLACSSPNPNAPMGLNWAAVDSDCAGEVDMDESLVTNMLDLRFALTATLEFDHYFNRDGTEIAAVDVRSSLTGGNWVSVQAWAADTTNPAHESIDITAQAAGAQDVEIRWHYYDANFAWYWYVDNLRVSFIAAGGCNMSTCPTGSPPGEQAGVHWPDANTLSWSMDPDASAGYAVYRGSATDLPALDSADPDSCVRFTVADPGDNAIELSGDNPPPSSFYWYVITGRNGVGEGTPGSGTDGPRIVNDSGACTP